MAYSPESIAAQAAAAEIDAAIRALPPGARAPAYRAVRQASSKWLRGAAPEEVIDVARHLLRDYGHRWFAYELIHYHRPALRSLGARELEEFGQGMDSWGAVDSFGRTLSGPAWREHQVPDERIHRWARSPDRWWRRAALVSTVPLNVAARGGSGDAPRTLAVCRMLAADPDDMVVKALSWALRDLVQHDREGVEAFLAEHDDILAARVKREVRNKLETGLKNPRRRHSPGG